MFNSDWLSIGLTFVSGIAGVAVGYGAMIQREKDQERRLTKVEDKIELQVGDTRCRTIREECKISLRESLADI